jgi:hypothetical protein
MSKESDSWIDGIRRINYSDVLHDYSAFPALSLSQLQKAVKAIVQRIQKESTNFREVQPYLRYVISETKDKDARRIIRGHQLSSFDVHVPTYEFIRKRVRGSGIPEKDTAAFASEFDDVASCYLQRIFLLAFHM